MFVLNSVLVLNFRCYLKFYCNVYIITMSLSLKNRTFDLRSYNNSTATPDVSLNILPDLTASIITTGTFGANVDVYSKTYMNNTFTIAADKITSGTLPAARIGTGSITTNHILNDTIVDGDINSSANISGSKIANVSIPVGKLNFTPNNISTANIGDNQITVKKLESTLKPYYILSDANTITGLAQGDFDGFSVSLSRDGSLMAIGPGKGSFVRAYIKANTGLWTQRGQDLDLETVDKESGYSVSIALFALVVGATGTLRTSTGAFRIYGFNPDTSLWVIRTTIAGSNVGDAMGGSVSINLDSDRLAVGIYNGDQTFTNVGKVEIWQALPVWTKTATIPETTGGAATQGYQKGSSVSLTDSGTRLVVGSRYANVAWSFGGIIEIYDNSSGNTWTLMATFNGDANDSYFGYSSAISGDGLTVVAGGTGFNTNRGYAKVYRYNNETWTQIGSNITGETADGELGVSVAISRNGNTIAVGAHKSNNFDNTGLVRLYRYNGLYWDEPMGVLTAGIAGEMFGGSISLSGDGNLLAVGAYRNSTNSGCVRTYVIGSLY
jgi:hypothetical protein